MTRAVSRLWPGAVPQESRSGNARTALPPTRPVWAAAAAASSGAGIIHLALGPEHVAALGDLGYGFFLSAALQLGWATALVIVLVRFAGLGRSIHAFAVTGIAINVAILAAWAVSRSVGLPAGEAPWTPEAIGRPDAIAGVLEGALILGLGASLRGRTVAPSGSRSLATAGAVLAIALMATGTAAAIEPGAAGHSHGPRPGHESDAQLGGVQEFGHSPETDQQDSGPLEASQPPESEPPLGVPDKPVHGPESDPQHSGTDDPSHTHDASEDHGH